MRLDGAVEDKSGTSGLGKKCQFNMTEKGEKANFLSPSLQSVKIVDGVDQTLPLSGVSHESSKAAALIPDKKTARISLSEEDQKNYDFVKKFVEESWPGGIECLSKCREDIIRIINNGSGIIRNQEGFIVVVDETVQVQNIKSVMDKVIKCLIKAMDAFNPGYSRTTTQIRDGNRKLAAIYKCNDSIKSVDALTLDREGKLPDYINIILHGTFLQFLNLMPLQIVFDIIFDGSWLSKKRRINKHRDFEVCSVVDYCEDRYLQSGSVEASESDVFCFLISMMKKWELENNFYKGMMQIIEDSLKNQCGVDLRDNEGFIEYIGARIEDWSLFHKIFRDGFHSIRIEFNDILDEKNGLSGIESVLFSLKKLGNRSLSENQNGIVPNEGLAKGLSLFDSCYRSTVHKYIGAKVVYNPEIMKVMMKKVERVYQQQLEVEKLGTVKKEVQIILQKIQSLRNMNVQPKLSDRSKIDRATSELTPVIYDAEINSLTDQLKALLVDSIKPSNYCETRNGTIIREVSVELIDPISFEVMEDPVFTPSGHSYDRKSIERWIDTSGTCPVTRKLLSKDQLTSNISLRNICKIMGSVQILKVNSDMKSLLE